MKFCWREIIRSTLISVEYFVHMIFNFTNQDYWFSNGYAGKSFNYLFLCMFQHLRLHRKYKMISAIVLNMLAKPLRLLLTLSKSLNFLFIFGLCIQSNGFAVFPGHV